MIVKALVAAIFLLSTVGGANAQTRKDCGGCNVVDNGDFGRQLVGRTVYDDFFSGALVVVDVRPSDKAVQARNGSGVVKWYNGYDVYTKAEMDERNAGKTAVVVGGLLLWMFGSGSSDDRSSNSNSGYSSQSRASCESACYRQGDPDPAKTSALINSCLQQCR